MSNISMIDGHDDAVVRDPMREKLIEILRKPIFPHELADPTEAVADYLLDNGVIVLPCKVGDTVWCVTNQNTIIEDCVKDFDIWSVRNGIKVRLTLETFNSYVVGEFGKTVFLTREEAEAALKEVQG